MDFTAIVWGGISGAVLAICVTVAQWWAKRILNKFEHTSVTVCVCRECPKFNECKRK